MSEEANRKIYNQDRAQSFDLDAAKGNSKFMASRILQFRRERPQRVQNRDEFVDALKEIDPQSDKIDNVAPYWDPKSTTVLDFGCGAGNISLYLKPYIKEAVGVDISDDMINAYKERTGFEGYACDIAHDDIPGLGNRQFEVIVCTLAYHHVDDYALITRKLVERLQPGGWLYVVDFDSDNKFGCMEHVGLIHGLGHDNSVPNEDIVNQLGSAYRDGFDAQIATNTFTAAGLTDVGVDTGFAVRMWPTLDELHLLSGQPENNFSKFERDSQGRCAFTFGVLCAVGRKPE